MKRRITWLVVGLLLTGCSEAPPPAADVPVSKAPAVDAPAPAKAVAKGESYESKLAGYRFTVPADWEVQPPKSEFILAEFSVPGEAGPARLTLSSAGGGIDANVERWRGQFQRGPGDPEPQESEITFDGRKGTLVELSGTFADMFTGNTPTKNWRMLGVAVPLGSTNYFLKMTGPAKTVAPRRDEFLKFVETARPDQ